MGRVNRGRIVFSIFLSVLLGCITLSSLSLAQEDKDKKDLWPERGIAVYTEYSGVTVPRGESVKMDLIMENKGRTDEVIDVKVSNDFQGMEGNPEGRKLSGGGTGLDPQWEDKEPFHGTGSRQIDGSGAYVSSSMPRPRMENSRHPISLRSTSRSVSPGLMISRSRHPTRY